jgi:hypothetical protein
MSKHRELLRQWELREARKGRLGPFGRWCKRWLERRIRDEEHG